jgi:uncharacterized protein (DUF2062 family)
MPKKLLRTYLPWLEKIRHQPALQKLGGLLHAPNIWSCNRHRVAGGVSVGLFSAFVPIPFQMLLAAVLAVLFRVNLPISVALVWVSNPITMPPLFYFCYWVGTQALGVAENPVKFALSIEWISNVMITIWQPFLLGCFLVGSSCALLGHVITRLAWRMIVLHRLDERRQKRHSSHS